MNLAKPSAADAMKAASRTKSLHGDVRSAVLNALAVRGLRVHEMVRRIEHTPSGALCSEMTAFISLAKEQNCNVILESGRAEGYSTECFARGFDGAVHSCDNDRRRVTSVRDSCLESLGVCCEVSDARIALPRWIDHIASTVDNPRIALFMDGPKGRAAFKLAEAYKHAIVFFAVHDLSRQGPSGERPHSSTQYAMNTYDDCFISSLSETWRRDASWMDSKRVAQHGEDWMSLTSEAFGIGFFKGAKWRQDSLHNQG